MRCCVDIRCVALRSHRRPAASLLKRLPQHSARASNTNLPRSQICQPDTATGHANLTVPEADRGVSRRPRHNAAAAAARPAKRTTEAAPPSDDEAPKRSKAAAAPSSRAKGKAPAPDAELAAPSTSTPAEGQGDDSGSDNKDFSAFYLMKNEPDDFSVDDLAKEPEQTTCWGALSHTRSQLRLHGYMRGPEGNQRERNVRRGRAKLSRAQHHPGHAPRPALLLLPLQLQDARHRGHHGGGQGCVRRPHAV